MEILNKMLVGVATMALFATANSAVVVASGADATPHGLPLDIVEDVLIANGASLQQIGEAIKKAAKDENWNIESEASGLITVRYPNRDNRYHLILNVYFNESNYRVRYVSSQGLDAYYDCFIRTTGYREWKYYPVCFHPKASKVTDKLKARIDMRLKSLGKQGSEDKANMYY